MNIQHVLSRVTAGDCDFFLNMTEEEVKELSPYVLTLWLRGANENRDAHVLLTDAVVNSKLFSLSRHPKLLYLLCCYANSGMGRTRYSFINDKKETTGNKHKVVMREFQCSEAVAKMYLNFLDGDDIKQLEKKYEEVDK